MAISLQTPRDVLYELRDGFKKRRLSLNFTQEGLAKRAGVSWGSLKRFEGTGQISLESLLKIALVLDCLADFTVIGKSAIHDENQSIDKLLAKSTLAKKGRIK